ncbi:hypothetical protein JTB14_007130 [Gonioctena quinquepunctata]|nr:hypothetical protein JTB14_007130 [Gonioctena quinquepunctata]
MSSIGVSRDVLRRVLNVGVRELCEQMLKRKRRRWWVRSWILGRNDLGALARLFKELELEDPSSYANILRMSVLKFKELLELVTLLIQKKDTKFREAIPSKTKLEITLRYLATGDSFKSLAYLFRVPHNTISVFVPEVLSGIYGVLQQFIKVRFIIYPYLYL